jgi:hypothetical protein
MITCGVAGTAVAGAVVGAVPQAASNIDKTSNREERFRTNDFFDMVFSS